jgi:hypothetical protein
MRSDEELRRLLARPDLPWPDETGAYERFLRRRGTRRGRVVAAAAGLVLVAVLGAAVLVARQLPQERAPAAPTANAAELADRAATAAAAGSVPTPRPHQWVYIKELRVEFDGGHKPWTWERWVRVDGRSSVGQRQDDRRAARVRKVRRERMDWPSAVLVMWPRCPPGKREQLARIRPAVGLGRFFPDPSAVPTDPDGLLAAIYRLVEDHDCAPIPVGDTVEDRAFMLVDALLEGVLPPEVRAALYRALAKIPGVTVAQGATDAAGRRGVAFTRGASIEVPGSSDWLRLEIILDNDTHRYLGTRYIVTRDHFLPQRPSGKGTRYRKGQVLASWAQLALAVVDAPCQRPGDPTTCASYVENTWVGG